MPVPSNIPALSVSPASNSPPGSESPTTADDYLRTLSAFLRQSLSSGADIASAGTINPVSTASSFNVTGTTATTGISSANSWDGRMVLFTATGAWPLTHSATFILPGAANITLAAGDSVMFRQESAGVWRCVLLNRAPGAGITLAALGYIDYFNSTRIDVASAATINLTTAAPNTGNINITGGVTTTGFVIAAGRRVTARVNAAWQLTAGAGVVFTGQPSAPAQLLFQAGDSFEMRATAANVVEIFNINIWAASGVRGLSQIAQAADVLIGTENQRYVTPAALRGGQVVAGTPVATTSGTSQTWSGIPSWASVIDVALMGFSGSGTSDVVLRLNNDATSTYRGTTGTMAVGAANAGPWTTGALLTHTGGGSNAATYRGGFRLTKIDALNNIWKIEVSASRTDSSVAYSGAGDKTLAAVLSSLVLTTAGGTDTADAGSWVVTVLG